MSSGGPWNGVGEQLFGGPPARPARYLPVRDGYALTAAAALLEFIASLTGAAVADMRHSVYARLLLLASVPLAMATARTTEHRRSG